MTPGRAQRTEIVLQLAEQRDRLRARIETSGLYRYEIAEFEIAVSAHEHLVDRLGIVDDLGSMTTPESRNVVRLVRLEDRTEAVLKVVGNTRESGEGELLSAWHRAGLPCVEPLRWGHVQVRSDERNATASYVVTRHVSARPLPDSYWSDDRAARVRELVNLVRPFHCSDVRVSRTRRWSDRLQHHLREIVPVLNALDAPVPVRWASKLEQLSRNGSTVVHGDPGPSNVLVTDRGLMLLDPPGSTVALPEADIAQICCHIGGVDAAPELLQKCAHDDEHLDPASLSAYAGLNLMVWAGYLFAAHDNPNVNSKTSTSASRRRDAEQHLAVARRLLDDYPVW